MVIAAARIELELHEGCSLKDKRRVVKSVIARLRQRYNLAAAEVDAHDQWQRAVIGLTTLSTDPAHAHSLLEKAIASLAEWRLDCELADYTIEIW
ncbi:MAG: DUF503 domain-containing protein [Caldilineales bacterium]|nr:DUF503 domain-containing protein [Caldilineales bacterium]